MLRLDNVSKSYGQTHAVRTTTLAIDSARTTVLIGPSGSGKSTLLRLMIGLIPTDTGVVRVAGETLDAASALEIRRRMGYVIQDGGLFPHLSARGNVVLLARYLGWAAPRVEARLAELADLTRFPLDGLDRYPIQLSGGQRQRVSLMRALMLDPQVLLLDEPLGSLDPMIRGALQDDLRDIFQTLKKTVVLVTHDLSEAAYFADTIVLMRQGRVMQKGKLADMLRDPAEPYVTEFINAQRRTLHTLMEGD
jgi:osmoprotectant transport system ATP-binding protein